MLEKQWKMPPCSHRLTSQQEGPNSYTLRISHLSSLFDFVRHNEIVISGLLLRRLLALLGFFNFVALILNQGIYIYGALQ